MGALEENDENLWVRDRVRIGAPATLSIDPLFEWPDELRQAVGNHTIIVSGGHEVDGEEISELDEDAIEGFLSKLESRAESVSITSVFSPVNPDHEKRAEEIVENVLGDVPVSVSNEIGSVGLLERENATALNAALVPVIERTSNSLLEALEKQSVDANVYFCQNDGTLMDLDYAQKYPVLTLASGPSNSMKGAAYLSDIENGVVVDIGGTTTDIGVLSNGFPRESSSAVEIGGIKTNFRMPDLISVAIGGGSMVKTNKKIEVGPQSVGRELTEKGLSFGGNITTATDVVVSLDWVSIGEQKPEIEEGIAKQVIDEVERKLFEGIEKMKSERGEVPVALVGGGSILVKKLRGASRIAKPAHYEVANAIGATISQVSGEIDRIFSLEGKTREEVLEEAEDLARREAIEAGANPETLETVSLEEIPLAYLPGDAVRVKVKAAGDLAL